MALRAAEMVAMEDGEGAAAAVGHVVVAERADVSATIALTCVVGDAELLRRHQRQRGARAADVHRADGQRHRAVHADVEVARRSGRRN